MAVGRCSQAQSSSRFSGERLKERLGDVGSSELWPLLTAAVTDHVNV